VLFFENSFLKQFTMKSSDAVHSVAA